mgnify:CR=1 FL=1
MTKVIYMAIELDQDIMVTNMCLTFGEDWTNSFQELDRKQSSVRTYGRTDRRTYVRTRATLYAATLWGHKKGMRYTRPSDISPSCYLLFHLTLNQTQVPFKHLEGNSTVFPCGSCEQLVTWSCKCVECDACFLWYHANVRT